MTLIEPCPKCGGTDYAICRDMIATRKCPCGHSWVPEKKSAPKNDDALELARCALVNLKNLARSIPRLSDHPFYKVVEIQLIASIKELEETFK